MQERILIDTGPIVAFLTVNERHHTWAKRQFALLRPPFYICEPAITEAAFLLSRTHGGTDKLFELLSRSVLVPGFALEKEMAAVRKLMARYESVPMSLADACLVRMSEIHHESRVFTLDSDFSVYRRNGRQVIPRIAPAQ